MHRLLVTGGSGLLGNALVRATRQTYDVVYTYHRHPAYIPGARGLPLGLDEDSGSVRALVQEVQPSIVVHSAALRSLDYCQEHPEEARKINVEGTHHLAEAARQVGAHFVHISTESVFDGEKGMYREEAPPNPLTVYGQTKLQAEEVVRELLSDALIVRTSSIYGKSLYGQSLAEFILVELKAGKKLEMIADSAFSPILSDNLAEAVLELAERRESGLYHVAGLDRCSRHDFALAVARVFGCDASLVEPVAFDQVKGRFRAPRARDLSLDVSRARTALRHTCLLGVEEGLARLRIIMDGWEREWGKPG